MSDSPRETELKFALCPGEGALVGGCEALAGIASRTERLAGWYFDTPARELAKRGLGLRLRREGRRWRATLKAEGASAAGLHDRAEWEYPAPGPRLDLARFSSTPLADVEDAARLHERLAPVLVADFRRTRWIVEPAPGISLEVAVDVGHLVARGRSTAVEELEIEVLSGPASAAFDLALAIAREVALRPEGVSKLARGMALAESRPERPLRTAVPDLAGSRDARQAARRIVLACLAQAQANEAGVLASADIEYVHQLRVALRRLRSALRLFREAFPEGETDALSDDLRWAATVLGQCRDWDVFVSATIPPLLAAWGDDADGKRVLARARAGQREARAAARQALRSTRYGIAMIRTLRWASVGADDAGGAEDLKDFASRQLRKGARKVKKAAVAFAALDAAGRHAARIEVKRLRYTSEFLASLFRPRLAARSARTLARAQQALGEANDRANALARVTEMAPPVPLREFARGWFTGQESADLASAGEALARAARLRRYWRKKPPSPGPSSGG